MRLLFTVSSTPYDKQMARIRPVLAAPSRESSNRVSLNIVNHWMGDLRSIPYGFTAMWKTPAETESGAPADCKAKAVALYEKMQANGATNVRLVIGKRTLSSRVDARLAGLGHAELQLCSRSDIQLGGLHCGASRKEKL